MAGVKKQTKTPQTLWRAWKWEYLMADLSAFCFPASTIQVAAAAWQYFNTAGSICSKSGWSKNKWNFKDGITSGECSFKQRETKNFPCSHT